MPPRFQQVGQGGGFSEWYRSLPVVTKYHATICLVVGVACSLGALNPVLLYFTWHKAVLQLQVGFVVYATCHSIIITLDTPQVWRLVTNFLFFGRLGPKFAFRMLWLYVGDHRSSNGTFQHPHTVSCMECSLNLGSLHPARLTTCGCTALAQ